jgi:serine protease Do
MQRKIEISQISELKMKIITLIFLQFITPFLLTAQNLGINRVEHIKKSVGKVIVNGGSGSGFFIDSVGTFVTNYHVIKSAIGLDSATNEFVQHSRIIVELNSSEKIDMIMSNMMLNRSIGEAEIYDYAVLIPKTTNKSKISFLKLGSFKDINEGDEILTCGFPFGINQILFTKGMLSTKFTEQYKKGRSSAWLDLTINSGNSGGPILKIGETFEDDIVIGIASFNLNPYAHEANAIYEKALQYGYVLSSYEAISLRGLAAFNGLSIKNNSLGISGCISIDHLITCINDN